ncbi:two-component regulator propeller domain-containing protein [Arcicella sp. LKC2W]|uniref:ligand-binding sensor domain-containing protein n=1 Tax=Arcicella sp. LKC2W TaxID=2984198 RepID=UPI002B21871B|nr:two-component regulator propeller domain-containing protein [Arcicella sp. LKC2W]MEA5460122.1 two-component regulator propeller domain-containing protein [Arcicella sp. LKC2W]
MKTPQYISSLPKAVVLVLFCTFKIIAQPYFFRHYQVENGLSNNAIYCSTQDKKGFMWFGTKDGLNRFDGYHFKTYKTDNPKNSLHTDLIYCISPDKKGTLWVGSSKGLFYFDYENEKLIPLIDTLKEVKYIQIDNNNQIWFISAFTLWRYNFKTKKLVEFPIAKYFPASSLSSDITGQIWVGTRDGFIQKFDARTQTFQKYDVFSHSGKVSSKLIQTISCLGSETIYVGTVNQGLKKFHVPTKTYEDVLIYSKSNNIIHVRDIKPFFPNELWLATESGIFILNTQTNHFTNITKKFLDPFSLTDNAVYSLCKDNEGGIWAGTFFGGVNYYSKRNSLFEKYFADNSSKTLSGNVIREICPDRFGNIWIGTEDAGLNKLNPKTGSITQFIPNVGKNSIAYTNIQGLLNVGDDLWIGTFEHGLDIMDIKTGKIKKHYNAGLGKYDLKSNFIMNICQTKSGEIFVATARSLSKYNPKMGGFEVANEIPHNTFTTSVLEDKKGILWIGTNTGVFFYNPTTKEKGHFFNDSKKPHSLTNNDINSMIEDSQQCLWFSTEGGGVCKLDKNRKTMTSLTMKDGLPSNFVLKVLEDNNKTFWIATSRGLANYNPFNKQIITYTIDNGLLSDQFNYNSGYKDQNGRIYFGSIKGMVTFDPQNVLQAIVKAPIYITDFKVENKEQIIGNKNSFLKKSIIYTDEITLPHDKSSFSIDFTVLSYYSPEMTSFSYFMKGLDKEWTEIKPNRKVYFTNLSPGKYIFNLKASINGSHTTAEKQLVITILSPWWATLGAYILYSIILIAIIYNVFVSYHIIIQDRKEKEVYEAKIDFFTNLAHEIRTPLTLIKGPIENLLEQVDDIPEIKEDIVLMDRNTNRLILLVTQILDFRKVETNSFSIDFNRLNVSNLLKESYQNFSPLAKKRKLEYTIEYLQEDIYAFVDEEALNKIFSNLFNNAIKFALKKVSVRILPIPEDAINYTIEFENDGLKIPLEKKEKIFEPFYRLKEAKQEGTGIGLALARSLTQLLNGDLYLKETTDDSIIFVLILPINQDRIIVNHSQNHLF